MQAVKNVSRTYTEVTVDGSGRCRRAEQTGSDGRGDFRPVADDVRTHTRRVRLSVHAVSLAVLCKGLLHPFPKKRNVFK